MELDNEKDEHTKRLADVINYISCKLMDDGHAPHFVAGILTACAMSIYRTTLAKEDYDKMIDSISASRYEIGPFTRSEQASLEDMIIASHSKYIH